ncbi:MAG: hypothetical protein ACXVAY_01275 [Mucilaginibacter sp.]
MVIRHNNGQRANTNKGEAMERVLIDPALSHLNIKKSWYTHSGASMQRRGQSAAYSCPVCQVANF